MTRHAAADAGREAVCGWAIETESRCAGFRVIAGVDEVGRGALCGPVVAAAVVLGDDFDASGIDDSKRLTRRQRERLADHIRLRCVAWSIGAADADEVDAIDIRRATHRAMRRAIAGLAVTPDLALVDGRETPDLPCVARPVIGGDALSVSIAAASVIAKVDRDATMRDWHERYPEYGLDRNKGYGSREHLDALRRLGPSDIHRRSFHGTQRWLF